METDPWFEPIYNKSSIHNKVFINTKLFKYFKKKAPIPNFNENQITYCHYDILSALQHIILNDQLFDPENPNIIFCDQELHEIFEMKVLHIMCLINCINVELIKSLNDLNQKALSPINHPIPKYKFFYIPYYEQIPEPFFNKIWGSEKSFGFLAQKNYNKLDVNAKYIVNLPLLKFLRTIDNVNKCKVVFEYKDICNIIQNYIIKNNLVLKEHSSMVLTDGDPIRFAFGNIKAFHRKQFTTFLNYQLTPFIEPLETFNTLFKQNNQTINIVQDPNGEYDTDESNYSYQNYETERCHDENDESDENSQETILNETIYDNEYEIDSEPYETGYTNDSSGDTDPKINIKIENINFIDNLTEWADSESEINVNKNLFKSKNEFKCIKCEKHLPHPFKYCSECWLNNSKNIPKRSNPRKRKKNFKTNVVPLKKIHLSDEEIQLNVSDEEIQLNVSENQIHLSDEEIQLNVSENQIHLSDEEIQLNVSENQINCSMCCDTKVNSSFIHGQTEHHVCCYACAKKIFNKHKRCPVCRKLIEKIVMTFKY